MRKITAYVPAPERQLMRHRLALLGFSSYGSYLGSGLWATSRRRLAGDRCEACGATKDLHLHHMTYATLGAERPADVCTLCPSCHLTAHAQAARGGTLYPEKVMQVRSSHPPRERKISAQGVACPQCGAKVGYPCFLPSGNVRAIEHKARRQADRAYRDAQGEAKRHRVLRKRARSRRMTPERLAAIEAARELDFPLDHIDRLP